MTRGERVITFIHEFCVVPEGDFVGNPVVLEDFQKKFILAVYDNPAGTDTAILSIARKNAKTTSACQEICLVLYNDRFNMCARVLGTLHESGLSEEEANAAMMGAHTSGRGVVRTFPTGGAADVAGDDGRGACASRTDKAVERTWRWRICSSSSSGCTDAYSRGRTSPAGRIRDVDNAVGLFYTDLMYRQIVGSEHMS